MFKLKEIIRLKYEAQLSLRQIALSLGLSVGVISKYLHRAETAGLGWPLPPDLSEQALTKLLQPPRAVFSHSAAMAEPLIGLCEAANPMPASQSPIRGNMPLTLVTLMAVVICRSIHCLIASWPRLSSSIIK